MMHIKKWLTVLSLTIIMSPVYGAEFIKQTSPYSVSDSLGVFYSLPFTGGLNNPKPVLHDWDNDGLTDLFIGEQSGKLLYYRNIGSVASPQWSLVSERFGGIDVGSWFTFCDIDADGDADLFCDSRTAKVMYYRNNSTTENISFSLQDTSFFDIAAGNNNTPAFSDIDNDNDYDFFYGNTTGYLAFYKNTGDSATPFYLLTDNAYDSVFAFPQLLKSADQKHGFSNIAFTDIDSDNDPDLFWGDIFNNDIYLFINNGSPVLSDLTWQTQDYLGVTTAGFNHPTFADLDNDTDLDLILGVASNADNNNLQYFENVGLPILASYSRQTTDIINHLDFGSASAPTIGDIDNDGDNDILVGKVDGRLALLENVGDSANPSIRLQSTAYQNISVTSGAAPVLYDWDNDTDLDLLIGTQSGRIEYWQNQGTPENAAFVQISTQLAGIKRDQLAIPQVADLNDDNLPDLVVGEWDFNSKANLLLYKNIGTIGAPNLILQDSALLNLENTELAIPNLYDYDHDGRIDILLANRNLGLVWYKNSSVTNQFPSASTLILQTDTIPGADDGRRIILEFADFDFDGDDDIVVGEENGGLNYYEQISPCCLNLRGNADNDPFDIVDISDLLYLVDYIFYNPPGPAPVCLEEADVNVDSVLDVSDLLYLVDYMFLDPAGPAPLPCQ